MWTLKKLMVGRALTSHGCGISGKGIWGGAGKLLGVSGFVAWSFTSKPAPKPQMRMRKASLLEDRLRPV